MSFIDKMFGRTPQESGPKIAPDSKKRIDEERKIATFTGTEAQRYALGASLNRTEQEVDAIVKAERLRNDPRLQHVAARNESNALQMSNDAERSGNPLKTLRIRNS